MAQTKTEKDNVGESLENYEIKETKAENETTSKASVFNISGISFMDEKGVYIYSIPNDHTTFNEMVWSGPAGCEAQASSLFSRSLENTLVCFVMSELNKSLQCTVLCYLVNFVSSTFDISKYALVCPYFHNPLGMSDIGCMESLP